MRTVRRAAAWVAWAEWICNHAAASGKPNAATGCSLRRAGFGPLFFFWCARQGALIFSTRRLAQDPTVAVRIREHRVASPRFLFDLGELSDRWGPMGISRTKSNPSTFR